MFHKELLSGAAIALTFIAFWPYIQSVQRGQTKPHVFSWVIWGSTTFVVFLAQLSSQGGAGAWPIGVSGIVTLYIAKLAYARKSDTTITGRDWLFLAAAMVSLPAWYFTSDPLWAVAILTAVDVIGFGPTFRKAYDRPFEEHLTFFIILAVRNLIAIAALAHYSLATVLFPAGTASACLAFVLMVAYRRRVLAD
jgi:hypothetical protein